MVKAAGVELSSVLRTRNLLIPGPATGAKKAPIARSIVRLLYENLFEFLKRRRRSQAEDHSFSLSRKQSVVLPNDPARGLLRMIESFLQERDYLRKSR